MGARFFDESAGRVAVFYPEEGDSVCPACGEEDSFSFCSGCGQVQCLHCGWVKPAAS